MREILFRGKDQYNDWTYGYLCQYRGDSIADNGGDLLDDSDYYIRDWTEKIDTGFYGCNYKVRPSTIGQYTGLTDKNGKKIFEGDICKFREWDNGKMCWIGYVHFEHCQFIISGGANEECPSNFHLVLSRFSPENIEVIGNIHDNPELLEADE